MPVLLILFLVLLHSLPSAPVQPASGEDTRNAILIVERPLSGEIVVAPAAVRVVVRPGPAWHQAVAAAVDGGATLTLDRDTGLPPDARVCFAIRTFLEGPTDLLSAAVPFSPFVYSSSSSTPPSASNYPDAATAKVLAVAERHNGRTQCFAPGQLEGVAHVPTGLYFFGIYVAAGNSSLAPLALPRGAMSRLPVQPHSLMSVVSFQVFDYRPSNVSAHIWSCHVASACAARFAVLVASGCGQPKGFVNDAADASRLPSDHVNYSDASGDGFFLARQVIPSASVLNTLWEAAGKLAYVSDDLDTIDKLPTFQVDLLNSRNGVPAPTADTLAFTSLVFAHVLPNVLDLLRKYLSPPPPASMMTAAEALPWDGWDDRNVSLVDAFVRKYKPGERLGVHSHADMSDVTVNCLLSPTGTFEGGVPYRWLGEWEVDLLPLTRGGDCMLHPGRAKHGAVPITAGTRYVLVLFWRVRERIHGSTSYYKHNDAEESKGSEGREESADSIRTQRSVQQGSMVNVETVTVS